MRLFVNRYYPVFINIYTAGVLYLLYFGVARDFPDSPFKINYRPFETIIEYVTLVLPYRPFEFSQNILGNIILFIPYGFLGILYPMLNRFRWLLIIFFIIINITEFSQYYFNRGFADIDDVILNTLGAVIGFVIYKKWFFIKGR
ncbi:VanZ family protein [Epilithonimonas mollis]|uniref:VanZ like family protein n=1 Tax=Epilithonimonas mollis TaxID=216903 RepID=A0A1M6NTL8_9FLAO|nr:VanZ family protein [Epilithonimonas mollis]SHJ98990.1 VanZ like family protein [Epilithonimonas mollis]